LVTNADVDFEIVGIGRCPDPSTPSGYGDSFVIGKSDPVEPDLTLYNAARWTGTYTETNGATSNLTSSWVSIGPGDFLTVSGLAEQSTGNRADSFGSIFGPPTGPVAWRTNVSAIQIGYGSAPPCILGVIGKNANANIFSDPYNSPATAIAAASPPFPFTSTSIQGKWELSENSGTTVAQSWQGRGF
jgi:hypothetical protein